MSFYCQDDLVMCHIKMTPLVNCVFVSQLWVFMRKICRFCPCCHITHEEDKSISKPDATSRANSSRFCVPLRWTHGVGTLWAKNKTVILPPSCGLGWTLQSRFYCTLRAVSRSSRGFYQVKSTCFMVLTYSAYIIDGDVFKGQIGLSKTCEPFPSA